MEREWTYRQTQAIARRTAIGLAALGVTQGDKVLSWLPNGPDAIRIWFGLNYLGAVYVPINLAYRGGLLAHVVANSDAKLIVAHADLVGRLADIDRAALTTAVVLNGVAPAMPGLAMHRARRARAHRWRTAAARARDRAVGHADHHLHLGHDRSVEGRDVVVPAALHDGHRVLPRRSAPDDRFMVNLPLFHVGGTAAVYAMLALGGSIDVVEAFDTASFWRVVTETGTTAVRAAGRDDDVPGEAAARPAGSQPHAHQSAIMVPLCEDAAAFSERFGCDVYTVFNMTEVSTPIRSAKNPAPLGTCGRPRPGVEARVVDENDCEVAPG